MLFLQVKELISKHEFENTDIISHLDIAVKKKIWVHLNHPPPNARNYFRIATHTTIILPLLTKAYYYPQVRKGARNHTVGGKSFSRLISRQGCLSHSGYALPVHSIIIPLLTKEGLGKVVGWVKRC